MSAAQTTQPIRGWTALHTWSSVTVSFSASTCRRRFATSSRRDCSCTFMAPSCASISKLSSWHLIKAIADEVNTSAGAQPVAQIAREPTYRTGRAQREPAVQLAELLGVRRRHPLQRAADHGGRRCHCLCHVFPVHADPRSTTYSTASLHSRGDEQGRRVSPQAARFISAAQRRRPHRRL